MASDALIIKSKMLKFHGDMPSTEDMEYANNWLTPEDRKQKQQ